MLCKIALFLTQIHTHTHTYTHLHTHLHTPTHTSTHMHTHTNDELLCLLYQDDLWHCLLHKVPLLLKSGKVSLVIVDSLAAVFRPDHVDVDLVKRAKQLSSFGGLLLQLTNTYNVPVVVVNQVG